MYINEKRRNNEYGGTGSWKVEGKGEGVYGAGRKGGVGRQFNVHQSAGSDGGLRGWEGFRPKKSSKASMLPFKSCSPV